MARSPAVTALLSSLLESSVSPLDESVDGTIAAAVGAPKYTFEEALGKYVALLNKNSEDLYKKTLGGEGAPVFSVDALGEGETHVRVVRTSGEARTVHAFVEAETGDIFKAKTWTKPAKASRGSVFTTAQIEDVDAAEEMELMSVGPAEGEEIAESAISRLLNSLTERVF
jgi:hypothetical protein